ncbi:MAG: ATP-dependent DNA helicase RecG [Rickettsiales bacterium]
MAITPIGYLLSDITAAPGIGKATAEPLVRLLRTIKPALITEEPQLPSLPKIRDLLFHLPSQMIDRRRTSLPTLQEEKALVTMLVEVETHHPPRGGKGGKRPPYRVVCSYPHGTVTLIFFHADRAYMERLLPVGEKRGISGVVEWYDGMLQMPHPDVIVAGEKYESLLRQEAVYPLTAGLSHRRLGSWIQKALDKLPALPEWQDIAARDAKNWPSFKDALRILHNPEDAAMLDPQHPARQRLAYDELFGSQLALQRLRKRMQTGGAIKVETHPEKGQSARLKATLPFQLTHGQQEVLADIFSDLASGERMLRLLQGDVGSGKTVVAFLAMMAVIDAGYQAAIMAPTEILARQHAKTIGGYLKESGISWALLTGSMSTGEKADVRRRMESGDVSLVIGTHALFQESIAFKKLGLIVIDEQHRFGVTQRMALSKKGFRPHVLLMTATPIPRTITMTLYGDLDVSSLKEKPAGRQQIITRAVPASRIAEITERLQLAIADGQKAYWICPLIEETVTGASMLNSVQAAEERYRHLKNIFGERVGLVHGRMKPAERDKVMQGFAGNKFDILVATTVVEVGVDVRDATIIVIENAERFGLAQLHQLRGRVGRGERQSSCILLYQDHCTEQARERLKVIREHDDGFLIAEKDLELRGGGDLLGARQSGWAELYLADLGVHRDLVTQARTDAKALFQTDPELHTARGMAAKQLLALFGYTQGSFAEIEMTGAA